MTICRLVKQVAQLYQSITFKRLLQLCVFVSAFHLERILVDLVRHNDLQVSCIRKRVNVAWYILMPNGGSFA